MKVKTLMGLEVRVSKKRLSHSQKQIKAFQKLLTLTFDNICLAKPWVTSVVHYLFFASTILLVQQEYFAFWQYLAFVFGWFAQWWWPSKLKDTDKIHSHPPSHRLDRHTFRLWSPYCTTKYPFAHSWTKEQYWPHSRWSYPGYWLLSFCRSSQPTHVINQYCRWVFR